MYYPDLSENTNIINLNGGDVLNVGWLDIAYPFNRGPTSLAFAERLKLFRDHINYASMGLHDCPFCPLEPQPPSGSGMILIKGSKDEIYIAPELILHYVTGHQYAPPVEFIESVMAMPLPRSQAYVDFHQSWDTRGTPAM